ncbi:MAG TPA: alpha/beta fold hydrolase [Candidatus Saccharimonas sp.]|nr:alpha/beta fold hydrolase [Candidatus Saccharimonas sp.]
MSAEHDQSERLEGGLSAVAKVAAHEMGEEARRQEFADQLEPSPESEQFKTEMADPRRIEDSETGINYAVYQLNRDQPGEPLLVNLAWSVSAESGVGRADINEYAAHLGRPIIVIDMLATGGTDIPSTYDRHALTFERLAQSQLRVLDQLQVDRFDIAGYSLGGVAALGLAAEAGDRVGQVVTIAAPGFEDISLVQLARGFAVAEPKHTKDYRTDAAIHRPAILEQDAAAQANTKSGLNLANATTLLKLARLMTEPAAAESVNRLSPHTQWTDVVGSRDAVTAWTGHLEAARRRNAEHPRSSTVHILGSETHSVGVHRPAMAEVVFQTLSKERPSAEARADAAKRIATVGSVRTVISRTAEGSVRSRIHTTKSPGQPAEPEPAPVGHPAAPRTDPLDHDIQQSRTNLADLQAKLDRASASRTLNPVRLFNRWLLRSEVARHQQWLARLEDQRDVRDNS